MHEKNVIHRDIKGLNVFMTRQKKIKFGDFGISKVCKVDSFLETKLGTPLYLAPELIRQ